MSPTLLPAPNRLQLDYLSALDDAISMVVATISDAAHCPLCGQPSTRIHSHYTRLAADLPWNGVAVRLRLTTRRFFCPNDDCRRKIFTERLPELIAPYSRRTLRLTDALELIGFALGGEAGARALVGLSMGTSPDTMLRIIRNAALPESETPRILGVDDFALRRGRKYGTILVDLERRCRVDVLPIGQRKPWPTGWKRIPAWRSSAEIEAVPMPTVAGGERQRRCKSLTASMCWSTCETRWNAWSRGSIVSCGRQQRHSGRTRNETRRSKTSQMPRSRSRSQ